MKIAIMGAMPEEMDDIISLFNKEESSVKPLSTKTIGNREYHCFSYCQHEIIVVFSRWGKVAAASTATTLINHFDIDKLIFTGVAGAASTELSIADIVIGTDYLQHDMDARPLMPQFEIPLTKTTTFSADSSLVSALQTATENTLSSKAFSTLPLHSFTATTPNVHTGLMASGDQFIADKTKVKQLATDIKKATELDLYTVDMESAAVAQICSDYEVPFAALRVISDKADGSAHLDFPRFIATLSAPLIAQITQHALHLNFPLL